MDDDGGPAPGGPAASDGRRERILDAVVEVVAERGMASTSVGLVIVRAGVSRRAFYERFAGLDECLIAVLNGALERAAPIVARAFEGQERWYDGMRFALAAMFEFFEDESELARVCIVEALAAGPAAREHRERVMAAFRVLVVAWIEPEVSHASSLVPEGAMASVLGIVRARLAAREPQPLLELLGPLMGMIVGPFMDGTEVAREIEQGERLARELLADRESRSPPVQSNRSRAPEFEDVGTQIPRALASASAYRARSSLQYLQQNPGASNREVGTGIGVSHHGQVSALLSRLERMGMLSKCSQGAGRPNAWRLTAEGELVTEALRENNST
jgi:AcrR family transcriptional regulator